MRMNRNNIVKTPSDEAKLALDSAEPMSITNAIATASTENASSSSKCNLPLARDDQPEKILNGIKVRLLIGITRIDTINRIHSFFKSISVYSLTWHLAAPLFQLFFFAALIRQFSGHLYFFEYFVSTKMCLAQFWLFSVWDVHSQLVVTVKMRAY